MNNIYLLKVMIDLNKYEHHFEDVYSNLEKAKQVGIEWLENELRKEYNDWFDKDDEKDIPRQELTKEQLFKLDCLYDFTIEEFNPFQIDELEKGKLKILNDDEYFYNVLSELEPVKKEYSYDYNGVLTSFKFTFKWYKDKICSYSFYMDPTDFDEGAGSKFKKGDIVKVKKSDYEFEDRLHVVQSCPDKLENQKYFKNCYTVITNHNLFDDGCHEHNFKEKDLELFEGELPEDSPIKLLSKIMKNEIQISNEIRSDIICGRIALNNAPSFRDIEELNKSFKKKM